MYMLNDNYGYTPDIGYNQQIKEQYMYQGYGQQIQGVNTFSNQPFGVYTPNNQFDLDENMLLSLGFTREQINTLKFIVQNNGKVTPSILSSYGLNYEDAKKMKYMYDIASGKIIIESKQDISKHLRKMFGQHRRISIGDLTLSKISKIERKAVIDGIKDDTFSIYNSRRYPVNERMYTVSSISNGRIFIKTDRKPVIKYGHEKKIQGVIEIVELSKDKKTVTIAVTKKYCKLCNRFIIVGSLRRPEFHHGMIEIMCIEGSVVYVFAQTMSNNKGEAPQYKGGTQRVYDYGFFKEEIQSKLIKVASDIYSRVCGVMASTVDANSDFAMLDAEVVEDDMLEDYGIVD